MDTDSANELERQLQTACPGGAPLKLREAVLNDVARELRAARWDRRLARAAVVLLAVGVGINAALVWQSDQRPETQRTSLARRQNSEGLIETAVVVAEATNAQTGRDFARQLAALSGSELTEQEIAAIEAATDRDRG